MHFKSSDFVEFQHLNFKSIGYIMLQYLQYTMEIILQNI